MTGQDGAHDLALRLVSALATVVSTVLLTTSNGPASARTVDERCWGRAPLPAAALAEVTAEGCSVVGRTVYRGGVSVVVPQAGVTVVGEGVSTRGEVAGLQVANAGHGVTTTSGRVGPASTGGAARMAEVTSPPACEDRAFRLEGHAWRTSYRYHLNLAKMPSRYRAKTVVSQVKAANFHLRAGTNTCGRPRIDTPEPTTAAAPRPGRTSRRPAPQSAAAPTTPRTSSRSVTCRATSSAGPASGGSTAGGSTPPT